MNDRDLIHEAESLAGKAGGGDSPVWAAEDRHVVSEEIIRRGLTRKQISDLRGTSGRIPYLDKLGK